MKSIQKSIIYGLLVLNMAIIAYAWFQTSGNLFGQDLPSTSLALGRISGLLLAFLVLLQFLTMSRARWLETTFGLDKISRIHRWNGYLILAFLISHPTLITFGYAGFADQTFGAQFIQIITTFQGAILAFTASWLFIFIIVLSVSVIRNKLPYEVWYGIHLLVYLAIILAFFHQQKLGGTLLNNTLFSRYWTLLYIFVFGNVIAYRFIRPLYLLKKHQFQVQKVVPENYNVNSVYITGKQLEKFHIKPGQFIRVRFLAKKFWWQSHPFSLSSAPNGQHLRISPKALGNFTSQIPTLKPGTRVLLDGPFGVFTEEQATRPNILLIAGGIGITPLRSLAETMVKHGKNVILLNANKTQKDIVFTKELESLSRKSEKFTLINVLSDDPSFPGEKGLLDAKRIKQLVPDVLEREVFLCGPPPMMKAVSQALRNIGLRRSLIHYERFAL